MSSRKALLPAVSFLKKFGCATMLREIAKGVECGRRQVSGVKCEGPQKGRHLDASWELQRRFLAAPGCLLRALERLLGGSREALGRLLEASKRYLRPKTLIPRILNDC